MRLHRHAPPVLWPARLVSPVGRRAARASPCHRACPTNGSMLGTQAGLAAVIHAAGRMKRKRGVLPGLRALHVAGHSMGQPLPRPDAAPEVEVVLLGLGRRLMLADVGPGGGYMLVTNDILQDVQTALAVQRTWDWDGDWPVREQYMESALPIQAFDLNMANV